MIIINYIFTGREGREKDSLTNNHDIIIKKRKRKLLAFGSSLARLGLIASPSLPNKLIVILTLWLSPRSLCLPFCLPPYSYTLFLTLYSTVVLYNSSA